MADESRTTSAPHEASWKGIWIPLIVFSALAAMAGVLVVSTLRRPDPRAFEPTSPRPKEVGDTLVGPVVYTVDARDALRWRYFDFSRGSVVEEPSDRGWDLAFQRLSVIANGGVGFGGEGGIADLGSVAFDSTRSAPESGYESTRARPDTLNPAIARWYDYSVMSHLLTPKPRTYVVRTADGRYAKVELLAYYCPGAVAGCMTFRYTYQGSGTRSFGR